MMEKDSLAFHSAPWYRKLQLKKMQTLENQDSKIFLKKKIINMSRAEIFLWHCVMNSVAKVVPNVTALMLCFSALSLLNIAAQG